VTVTTKNVIREMTGTLKYLQNFSSLVRYLVDAFAFPIIFTYFKSTDKNINGSKYSLSYTPRPSQWMFYSYRTDYVITT
jgi:hypothetical protein